MKLVFYGKLIVVINFLDSEILMGLFNFIIEFLKGLKEKYLKVVDIVS